MAGKLAEQERTKSPDILFDLTPEDDKKLRESDLLDLINYGQSQREILIPGTSGKNYKVELALLWDEDYVDILKKTSYLASDNLLRIKVLRRLKLFKSIQRIDSHDYSDGEDPVSQRELWAIFCRLSEIQVEYIEQRYKELELERDFAVSSAIRKLDTAFTDTLTENKGETKSPTKEESSENADPTKPVEDEHVKLFKDASEQKKTSTESVGKAVMTGANIKEGTTSPQPARSGVPSGDA